MAARLLHAPPPLAARGPTRRRKNPVNREICYSFLPSSLSSPVVTCKNNQECNKAIDFDFDFPFTVFGSASLPAAPFLFVSPLSLFQAVGSVTKGLLATGSCRACAAGGGWRDLERGNAGGGCSRWLRGEQIFCTRRRQTRRVDGWIGDFPSPTSFLHRPCRPLLPLLGDRRPLKSLFYVVSLLSFGIPPYFFVFSVMHCC